MTKKTVEFKKGKMVGKITTENGVLSFMSLSAPSTSGSNILILRNLHRSVDLQEVKEVVVRMMAYLAEEAG